ncbi:MAG: DegT/DnrJ/EryC1/StrS family aminotransferase [Anaerolineales bacterium]|nr:DegT/DnrJ/EryC1/StrS family aminotransferase [Anaerolineales bacterium]
MIPAFDLKRQHQSIRAELDEAYARVLERGAFILGEEVEAFEAEFANYCGTKYAVGVASGTEALQLALSACGVRPRDDVLTVSHTAVATVAAVKFIGARPRFADVDLARYALDPEKLESSITQKTRALLPVHLYGGAAEMTPILDFARARGLVVVEDAAQAHGAVYRGRKVGGWGNAAAFSFYPTKNLGALGDGGAITTDDSRVAEKARLLRQYGWKERYVSSSKGINSRLDEMQAAFLRVKLRHLNVWNQRRRRIADIYFEALSALDLTLPLRPQDGEHVFHQFVIRSPRRDELREHLKREGIGTLIHYPMPVHLQPAYADIKIPRGALQNSEQAAREVLSLPIFPELTDDEARQVADAIRLFFKNA